jgi:hypothetical protein
VFAFLRTPAAAMSVFATMLTVVSPLVQSYLEKINIDVVAQQSTTTTTCGTLEIVLSAIWQFLRCSQ